MPVAIINVANSNWISLRVLSEYVTHGRYAARLVVSRPSIESVTQGKMDIFSNPKNLKLLQQLLSADNEDEEATNDRQPANRTGNPVESAEHQPQAASTAMASTLRPQAATTLDEWERQQERLNDDLLEHRLRPQYDIVYKQAVCTEDVFLQLGNKTAATASCEQMTIRIWMPDENVTNVDHMQLDVSANAIDLQTPKYRLKLPLVQPIDPDKGNARWDAEAKLLTLTLRMDREFDFVNF